MLLKKINKWIAIRNKNYKYFSNILSKYNKTALHKASKKGYCEIVKLLIDN